MGRYNMRETVSTSAWCLINTAKESVKEEFEKEQVRRDADASAFSSGACYGFSRALEHLEELMRSIDTED